LKIKNLKGTDYSPRIIDLVAREGATAELLRGALARDPSSPANLPN
tara:strand:+ start:241 stop:378 length:138 start_codon:yes stop_codon:yes gene_type:complete